MSRIPLELSFVLGDCRGVNDADLLSPFIFYGQVCIQSRIVDLIVNDPRGRDDVDSDAMVM
jgi:hypothetical protein